MAPAAVAAALLVEWPRSQELAMVATAVAVAAGAVSAAAAPAEEEAAPVAVPRQEEAEEEEDPSSASSFCPEAKDAVAVGALGGSWSFRAVAAAARPQDAALEEEDMAAEWGVGCANRRSPLVALAAAQEEARAAEEVAALALWSPEPAAAEVLHVVLPLEGPAGEALAG